MPLTVQEHIFPIFGENIHSFVNKTCTFLMMSRYCMKVNTIVF